MLLIIAEKPGLLRRLMSLPINFNTTDVIYTYALGLFEPSNPCITFNDIPYTPEWEDDRFRPFLLDKPMQWLNGGVKQRDYADEVVRTIRERVDGYSEIIIATDNDKVGSYSAVQLIKKLSIPNVDIISRLSLASWDSRSLLNAFNERASYKNSGIEHEAKQQELKRSFDLWWKINSELVLGEACSKCGLKGDPAISKYELMLYFFLSQRGSPLEVDEILTWMRNPKSKKEAYSSVEKYVVVGSAMSQISIIETAILRGALEETVVKSRKESKKPRVYALSDKAHQFLSLMHPKTRDDDLPFRIYEWMSCQPSELSSAKEKIRRYINTVFGRQFRYQRRHPLFIELSARNSSVL